MTQTHIRTLATEPVRMELPICLAEVLPLPMTYKDQFSALLDYRYVPFKATSRKITGKNVQP